jgi:hypothetical protein
MAKSEDYANEILDYKFGSGSPATLYFGLYTDMPDADGTGGTEVAGGSYARVAKTNNNTNFPAAAAGVKSNATAITFATASALWGDVVGVGIFDASSGGLPSYFDELENDRTVNNGDSFEFAIDQLVITEA